MSLTASCSCACSLAILLTVLLLPALLLHFDLCTEYSVRLIKSPVAVSQTASLLALPWCPKTNLEVVVLVGGDVEVARRLMVFAGEAVAPAGGSVTD